MDEQNLSFIYIYITNRVNGQRWHTLTERKRANGELYQTTVRIPRGTTLEYSSSIFVNCHACKGTPRILKASHVEAITSSWKSVAFLFLNKWTRYVLRYPEEGSFSNNINFNQVSHKIERVTFYKIIIFTGAWGSL